jgi:hypothetical protein
MDVEKLTQAKHEVEARLAHQSEPPWSWFRLMKLREALEDVIGGLEDPMLRTESSLQSGERLERHHQPVVSIHQLDNAQYRPANLPQQPPK